MPKDRYRREGDTLERDNIVVLRGGALDHDVLRVDAQRNHRIYGSYGVSVFALRDATLDEIAQKPPLVRFDSLTLITVGALRVAELPLEPTGRDPHHFDVVLDVLEPGLARLCACEHRTVPNPYNEG